MKVLIQNCKTHEYYAGEEGWVREKERAKVFPSSIAALSFIAEERLEDVQIKFIFGDPKFDMVISKSEGCP
ncbi:MAG TPA: hypothetical protein VFB72_05740 [Verrucomicrobiae bacterium]|nr:hypothetical protein [Verrucomicrobiae bacterium]